MKKSAIIFILCINVVNAFAQFPDKLKNGLRYYIDSKDSSRFITLNMTAQLWLRDNQNNPGTTVQGTQQSNTMDVSVRRLRFMLSGALTDRVSFFVQFGQNNLNYLSARKAGSFFHDVTADYAVIKKHFSIGAGLNGWNGPSRFSNFASANLLALDPPAYQEVTNDTYDQFMRRLGVYAKGKINKLDYRISVAKPFVIQTASGSGTEPINPYSSTFSTLPPNLVYQGYLMYQFLDQEDNFIPIPTGSYLGKKKVFNIGGGFFYQKNGMFHYANSTTQDTVKQSIMLFALDLFYDTPLNKNGSALSVYANYSNYNYGYNFVQVTGANNSANGTINVATLINNNNFVRANFGNAFPFLGTGNVGYIQAGYKFKNNLLKEQGTLQPYFDLQYANYARLKDAMYIYDVGVNWLIYGNNSKVTFNYQNRPYFSENTNGNLVQTSRLGQFVVQYQVAF